MGVSYSQMFPPAPGFTPDSLPDLTGGVYLVTGGASGIGAELVKMLYRAGAKVYIAGRSRVNAERTMEHIQARWGRQAGVGALAFLEIDLADLKTVRTAALEFQEQEQGLDVLFNNAAVSLPPAGSLSAQGYELTMATNVLGPHLLTQLLLPVLRQTPDARIVWTTSQNAELGAPKGGFTMKKIQEPTADQVYNYNASKIGNYLLSSELARGELGRTQQVQTVTQNPGNVQTNLLRHMPKWQRSLVSPLLHSAYQGALTELYAGLSPEIRTGDYVIPWGRKHPSPRQDFVAATKRAEEGGTGLSFQFKQWCDECVREYM